MSQRTSRGPRLPSASSHAHTFYHLVVCGATDPEADASIFSDFLAFCTYLGSLGGVRSDFYNCMEVDKPSGHIKNIRPDALKQAVLNWISSTVQIAKPGDAVNIIFECRRSRYNEFALGTNNLSVLEFNNEVGRFATGVQVNAISRAGYSGLFNKDVIVASGGPDRYISLVAGATNVDYGTAQNVSNRCRGSRYEHAWIQSFAKMPIFNNASKSDPSPTTTIAQHEKLIAQNLQLLCPTTRTSQTPGNNGSSQALLAKYLEDLVVMDRVDILYDPRITSSRRRKEWPSLDPDLMAMMAETQAMIASRQLKIDSTVEQDARNLLLDETKKCDRNMGVPCDIGIFDLYPYDTDREVGEVLSGLSYRSRFQSAILDVFMALCQRGYLKLDCLKKPVNIRVRTRNTDKVDWLLTVDNLRSHGHGTKA